MSLWQVSTGVSSTDRLQRLLSDSKRLVDTITSNESKSPTHLIAQLVSHFPVLTGNGRALDTNIIGTDIGEIFSGPFSFSI